MVSIPRFPGILPLVIQIKICGLTNAEDALLAANAGADALGFIGVPGTPRCITPMQFQAISARLPVFLPRVIVVRQPEDAAEYRADWVQYYEEGTLKHPMPARRIRAFRMRDESSLQEMRHYSHSVDAVQLDAYHAEKLGGSGATFDWTLAAQARNLIHRPVLLAGGLTPDNIVDALTMVRPDGVDVSSGVEATPGVKDPGKLHAFVQAVRDWESQNLQKPWHGATISHG